MTDKKPYEPVQAPGAGEPIVPIDFTPLDGKARRSRFRLSPARIVLGGVLLLFACAAWFVLTAKSVFIDVAPLGSDVAVHSPMALKIGPRYLMREGEYAVAVRAEGYYPLDTSLTVGEQQAQTFNLELTRLPGFLNLSTGAVEGARVFIDGEEVGRTPLRQVELAAGEHTVSLRLERYENLDTTVEIEGRSTEQDLNLELLPAWAKVSFTSRPAGASVQVNGEEVGVTPLTAEILEGEHEVLVKLPAHKAWTDSLAVTARQDLELPLIELEAADGLVLVQTTPSNAGVMLNGTYKGQTPLDVAVTPGEEHRLTFFRNGYQEAERTVRIGSDEERSLHVELRPITNSVAISASPADAELYVDGRHMGKANQTLELLAASQKIEIRKEGYVAYETEFVSRPGLEQKLEVSLKTLEQQRLESIKPQITTAAGQTLKLVRPTAFTMGASRREAGRQANEVMRNVDLTRPYYLSLTEVTNAQFAKFNSRHSSGVVEGRSITLSNNDQPVVRVSWEQAALYCNWLSEQEDLPLFYTVEDGKVTGYDPESTGYRLPTEAEWEWAARVSGDPRELLRFPWGAELPPPENHGNYADLSAASLLGRILTNYEDSFVASAPVGTFAPNANGFHDMGGNVAEWAHDFYGATGQLGSARETDPLGPEEGTYHVIRGSSWAHGTVTELRLSYRDYGNEPRDDVGFRVARYLE